MKNFLNILKKQSLLGLKNVNAVSCSLLNWHKLGHKNRTQVKWLDLRDLAVALCV